MADNTVSPDMLEILLSKLDQLQHGTGQENNTPALTKEATTPVPVPPPAPPKAVETVPITAISQGLQAIDAKLTALDHVARQLFRQAKQTPPKRALGMWHMVGVLLLVAMVGVVVGAGIGWRLTPAVDAALIRYTTKAVLEELQPTKGKR